jgi:hypothetical protein
MQLVFTSRELSKERCVTLVQPEMTARAAASALTASRFRKTSSAPSLNFSISSGDTMSNDLKFFNNKI